MYDVVIVGAGPAGLTAAIAASGAGVSALVLEAGPRPGRKLLASGGGRCNVTNTLPVDEFMGRFGRHGRFMQPALERLGSEQLRSFLLRLGVETHAPDGFHVFPTDHDARSVLEGLLTELQNVGATLRTNCPVVDIDVQGGAVRGVKLADETIACRTVVLACGGCGYPALGGDLSGQELAQRHGHRLVDAHPGMVPLLVRETWPARCTADTVPRAELGIRRPGKPRITGRGDLIFTRHGLAGPVVLDLAREISPLLASGTSIAIDLDLTGRTQEEWLSDLGRARTTHPRTAVADWLHAERRVGRALAAVFCEEADVDPDRSLEQIGRKQQNRLAEKLARLRITVTGTAGWDRAMVMRGGVSLRDVRPETLASRRLEGLFLAGEMLDLDGPCGGFNLQWAFASGHLAGSSAAGGSGRAGDNR